MTNENNPQGCEIELDQGTVVRLHLSGPLLFTTDGGIDPPLTFDIVSQGNRDDEQVKTAVELHILEVMAPYLDQRFQCLAEDTQQQHNFPTAPFQTALARHPSRRSF